MANKDAEIHAQILARLEQDTNLTLQKVAEECNRLENFKHDNQKIEDRENCQMHAVCQETNKEREILKNLTFVIVEQITRIL